MKTSIPVLEVASEECLKEGSQKSDQELTSNSFFVVHTLSLFSIKCVLFLFSENGENLSVQGLDGTNFTEQKTNDLLRNNKEANPATADKVMYSVVSRFQGMQKQKQNLNSKYQRALTEFPVELCNGLEARFWLGQGKCCCARHLACA